MVVVPEIGPVWFAKNSDREPTEAQFLECHDGTAPDAAPDGLPDTSSDARLLLSRPAWMWGCEMGVNQHGVAIGNEAVFTRLPVPKAGYTGMDFQRVALTTCRTADDALEQLIELTERFTQGGPMGHRHRSFRYHSSFIVADPSTAWVFETAGQYWAAKRVQGVQTISNALTIENDFDRVHGGAYELARSRGWAKSAEGFSFAGAFSDPLMSLMAGAQIRRACTRRSLSGILEPQRPGLHPGAERSRRARAGEGAAQRVAMRPCVLATDADLRADDELNHRAARRNGTEGLGHGDVVAMPECVQACAVRSRRCCRPTRSMTFASTRESSGGPTNGSTEPVSRTTMGDGSRSRTTASAFKTNAFSLQPTRIKCGANTARTSTTGSTPRAT